MITFISILLNLKEVKTSKCSQLLGAKTLHSYLIIPPLCVAVIWRLISDEHVIEIFPREGANRFCVVR